MNLFAKFKIVIREAYYFPQVLFLKFFFRKPDVIISFGVSPGDDLLCSIVAQQIKKSGYKTVWIATCFPEIFLNNPDIDKVIRRKKDGRVSLLMRKYFAATKARIIKPWYTYYDGITDQDSIPEKHIAHVMCDIAGADYPEILRPKICLTEREKEKGKLYNNQVCVQSCGKGAKQHMRNKDWYSERFQEVVDALKIRYTIIQIGSNEDPLLEGVIDMRGKTTIREAAAILYHSKFFIGQVGLLMHLARAVDCRSVIIYGGRERPDQSGYECNINLYSPVFCSPCWLRNKCLYDRKCMDEISARTVIEAAESLFPSKFESVMK